MYRWRGLAHCGTRCEALENPEPRILILRLIRCGSAPASLSPREYVVGQRIPSQGAGLKCFRYRRSIRLSPRNSAARSARSGMV